jgi:hypothetical protein
MITPTDNWIAANAKLAKKPILAIEIEGYSRTLTSEDIGGAISGLPTNVALQIALVNNGGSPPGVGTLTLPKATPAGNVLFAFMNNDVGASDAISDTAGNIWNPLYLNVPQNGGYGIISVWYAIAVASGPGNQVTFSTGALTISGFPDIHSTELYVIEVPARYSGFVHAHSLGTGSVASASTSDGNSISVPMIHGGVEWDLIMISLAPPSGAASGLSIAFLCEGFSSSTPVSSGQILATGGGFTYIVSGPIVDSAGLLVLVDPLTETVSDLDGGSDLSDLVFTVQDRGQAITADMAGFTFEGKKVVLKEGFVGLAYEDYLPRFTGKIENVDSGNANLEYTFTCPDIRKDLSAIIYTTGDDGFATSSDHPRTLNGHPLDILADLLENEIGWSSSIIDIAKIQLWRDTIYSGVQFLFRKITSAPVAKDFIENEIMKPLGAYHRTNNLGIFTVNFFYPINPAPVATLDHGTLTDVPVAQQAVLVNQNVFRFDYDDSDKEQAEKVASYAPSIDKYALAGENIIESRGLRSAFGGYAIAAIVSRLIFLRYANKQLQFDGLPNIWSQSLLEPGDITSITSSIVPDRELGVLGITAKSFEILDRSWDPMEGIASFKLLAVDLSKFSQFKIAPNAEADFLSASPGDQSTYLFLSDDSGKYSDGTPANTLC